MVVSGKRSLFEGTTFLCVYPYVVQSAAKKSYCVPNRLSKLCALLDKTSQVCLLLIPRILSPSPTRDLVDTASWVGFGSPGRLKACVHSLHALLWMADLLMTWIEKWDLFSIFNAFFRSPDRKRKKRGNAGSAFASSDFPNTETQASFCPFNHGPHSSFPPQSRSFTGNESASRQERLSPSCSPSSFRSHPS